MHPEDVPVQAVYEEVPLLGGHLASRQHQEAVPLGEIFDVLRLPEAVVIGDAHAVQADPNRLLDKLVRQERAVIGGRVGVGVYVYDQERQPPTD